YTCKRQGAAAARSRACLSHCMRESGPLEQTKEDTSVPISPIPQCVYPSVTALDPKALRAKGITLVLADQDNTLAAFKVLEPDPGVAAWKEAVEREGIQLFILSNSRKPGRAQKYAEALGVPFQGHSGKPKKAGYLRAMERMGRGPR